MLHLCSIWLGIRRCFGMAKKAESVEAQALHPVRAHDEMDLGWETATKRVRESNFYRPLFEAAFGEKAIDSTLITYAIAQFV